MEFFNRLNRTEWVPVLISEGFQNLIRRAQNELDIDYEKTPRQSLHELMRGLRITFIGLDENCAAFRRLSKIKGLKVISGVDKNFNVDSLKYTDFIFYYKNHAAHSVIWRSITQTAGIPYCYL